jgi:hypothetical protein
MGPQHARDRDRSRKSRPLLPRNGVIRRWPWPRQPQLGIAAVPGLMNKRIVRPACKDRETARERDGMPPLEMVLEPCVPRCQPIARQQPTA